MHLCCSHMAKTGFLMTWLKCSPKFVIISVRRSDKQTLAIIVHTISIVKKIAEDDQSGILMPFGVKKIRRRIKCLNSTTIYCP